MLAQKSDIIKIHSSPRCRIKWFYVLWWLILLLFFCFHLAQLQKACYMKDTATASLSLSLWLPEQQLPDTICSTCVLFFIHMHSNRAETAALSSALICCMCCWQKRLHMLFFPELISSLILGQRKEPQTPWISNCIIRTLVHTCTCLKIIIFIFWSSTVCVSCQVSRREAEHVLQCCGSSCRERPWGASCHNLWQPSDWN